MTLVLTEADGTVVGRQPLWVGWKYDVAGIIGAPWTSDISRPLPSICRRRRADQTLLVV